MESGSRDPVCGMRVDPAKSRFSHEHDGQRYYFCCGGCHAAFQADPTRFVAAASPAVPAGEYPETATDPVCGMSVDPARAVHSHRHDGQTYYFCCAGCRAKFEADPDRYLTPGARREAASGHGVAAAAELPADEAAETWYSCPMCPEVRQLGPGACPKCGMALDAEIGADSLQPTVEYTCPMHPEVVREGPGSCPECGMALEPRTVVPDAANPELDDMTRRFRWAALVGFPVFGPRDGRDAARRARRGRARPHRVQLAAARVRDPGGVVGGVAVLRPRLGVGRQPQPQHVHPHRPRRWGRLRPQRRRDGGARPVPRRVPDGRRGRAVLRHRGGHRRAGAAGAGPGAAGARPDGGGPAGPAGPGPGHRAPGRGRARRGGGPRGGCSPRGGRGR